MSLHPELRAIIGAEAVGAIIEGTVLGMDADTSCLMRVRVGQGELKGGVDQRRSRLETARAIVGARPDRCHQRAADLSVRNVLEGIVCQVAGDSGGSDLITIDIGGRIDHGAHHPCGHPRARAGARQARVGAGEIRFAARTRGRLIFTRVPKCSIATM
jgi:hypothetical protein